MPQTAPPILNDARMRSIFIAKALTSHLEDPDTVLVHELRLSVGKSRADLVLLNGTMHGYELKSEADCLDRLGKQRHHYNQVFDKVDLVVHERHWRASIRRASRWWGFTVMEQTSDGLITLHRERDSQPNPNIDPYSLASLLWKSEALGICTSYGVSGRFLSRPRHFVWQAMSEALGLERLRQAVRETLKSRYRTQYPTAHVPCDGSSELPSKAQVL